jgi:hypothetical protein
VPQLFSINPCKQIKKGLPVKEVLVSFFSMPTPALTGSGNKSVFSAIVFCNTKVAPLLKKDIE